MDYEYFEKKLNCLIQQQESLLNCKNQIDERWYNGLFHRYKNPVLTREHTPLFWRFDYNFETNPYLIERLGINSVFNPGAIEIDGTIYLMTRVEGKDRKSFFAIAESKSPVDGFRFRDCPTVIPDAANPDINIYDMRLVKHEDGWIYGIFCTERKDPSAGKSDMSSAIAQCGIVRTRDMKSWERLNDFQSDSPQQRNVVLHPEFIEGKYAFYTRPQNGFINAGDGLGIGWALSESIENAVVHEEKIVDSRVYHTIKELKNGAGPAPIKTEKGWLHIAHGVRSCSTGLRYVLYAFLCDLNEPDKVIHQPGGYLISPRYNERLGDVSNSLFCNGAIASDDGSLYIYYASADTRVHVAETTIDKMLDYMVNTPEDPLNSHACVSQRIDLIKRNLELMKKNKQPLYS